MTLPPRELADALERELGTSVTDGQRIGGGCINDGWRIDTTDGERLFVKTRQDAPPGEYAAEAASLRWLAEPDGGAPVPAVRAVRDDPDDAPRLLALEWIDDHGTDAEYLGRGLAAIHAAGAARHGQLPPGAPPAPDGATPLRLAGLTLPSDPTDDWPTFYAEQRLAPLIAPARDSGSLSRGGAAAVERVCERIADLAGPPEPPARLHGDLWGGNVLGGWLIDPAAYGGHREVDLAMLGLFGGPGTRTLAAYQEAHPLAPGYEQRAPLWRLFPLLVHAVLFGGSYGSSVDRTASELLH